MTCVGWWSSICVGVRVCFLGDCGMRTSFVVAVVVVVTFGVVMCGVCTAVELTQEFKAKQGFTIRLPGDWVEIPKEVMDEAFAEVKQMNRQFRAPHYGFQLASEEWMDTAYVMVQVYDGGKIPEPDARGRKEFEKGMKRGARDNAGFGRDVISEIKVGEITYDSERRIIWSSLEVKGPGGEQVREVVATVLTEKGAIYVAGFARGDEYEKWVPVFRAMAESVVLPEKLKYRSRRAFEMTPHMWTLFGLGVLIGLSIHVGKLSKSDPRAAKKWAWAGWLLVSGALFMGAGGVSNVEPRLEFSMLYGRIVGRAIGACGIPALVFGLAAGWRPWRRKKAMVADDLRRQGVSGPESGEEDSSGFGPGV